MPLILGLAAWSFLLGCIGFASQSMAVNHTAAIVGVLTLALASLRAAVSTARYLGEAMWSRRMVQRARRWGLIGDARRADFAAAFQSVPSSDKGL